MKIVLALVAVVAALVVVVAFQPADFRVARSTKISAPPAVVFAQVNDFHQWEHWSPWAKLDPEMKQSFTGAAAGMGASYSWAGNSKVGEGRMTITESRPAERIQLRLEFLKPMAATNTAEFAFASESDQTTVTWTMSGKKNFLCKAFGLVMNMDKMLGGDFEKGLAAMKAKAESTAEQSTSTLARR